MLQIIVEENRIVLPNDKVFTPLLKKFVTQKREYDNKTDTMRYLTDKKYYVKEEHRILVHVGAYPYITSHLRSTNTPFEVIINARKTSVKDVIKVKKAIKPRIAQQEYLDALNIHKGGKALFVAPPGFGKTVMSVFALEKLGGKVATIFSARYIAQWTREIQALTNVKREEIYHVVGNKALQELLDMSQEQLDFYKVFMLSNATIINWLNQGSYGKIKPCHFFNHIGVHNLLVDEAHQRIYDMSELLLKANPYRVLALSATYNSSDPITSRIQETIFPLNKRIGKTFDENYVDLTLVDYKIRPAYRIRTETVYGFNSKLYYGSLLKIPSLRDSIFDLTRDMFIEYYLKDKRKGDVGLIFSPTKDGVYGLTTYLKNNPIVHNGKKLKIAPIIDKTTLASRKGYDVYISTDGKLGTAIDIKGLTTVVSPVNIGSSSLNEQMVGRLRNIPGRILNYVQLYTSNISRINDYTRRLPNYVSKKIHEVKYRDEPIVCDNDGYHRET